MPNKTIYVSDEDLEVFERAQELAGSNLSATIAKALKRFIEVEEKKNIGFEKISIKIGENGLYNQKWFVGKKLGQAHFINEENNKATVIVVYETVKHQYAVHICEIYRTKDDLMKLAVERKLAAKLGVNLDMDPHVDVWTKGNKYRLDVYKNFDELKANIPSSLFNIINESITSDFLDI